MHICTKIGDSFYCLSSCYQILKLFIHSFIRLYYHHHQHHLPNRTNHLLKLRYILHLIRKKKVKTKSRETTLTFLLLIRQCGWCVVVEQTSFKDLLHRRSSGSSSIKKISDHISKIIRITCWNGQ